jgi:multiple sugar transport system permease protein
MKILVVLVCLLAMLPVYWMAIGSLQDIHGVLVMPPRPWPTHPTLNNYTSYGVYPMGRWALNSLFVLALGGCGGTLVSALAGYAFATYEFAGKRVIWMLLLAGILIPYIAVIIPRFVIIRRLGLYGTLWAAVVPLLYTPINMFLARRFFETIPKSMLDSARIDGCREAGVLFRIIIPLSLPIIAALTLFSTIAALGDFLWQMLVLPGERISTMLVGVIRSSMKRGGDLVGMVNPIGRAMAAGMILFAPFLVLFALASRYFTQGLSGAVKE